MSKTIKIAYKRCVTYKNADRINAEIVLTCMMQPLLSKQFYFNNLTNKRTLNKIIDKMMIK